MNLEMPSPAETGQLRTLLLVVLGIMIVTIPVIAIMVVAKVQAQRRQRPPGADTKPAAGSVPVEKTDRSESHFPAEHD